MLITNELGLPEPIIKALEADPYSPGACDITVTKLISPPRKVALLRKYGARVTRDASDMIFALIGQAFHVIMERADQQAVTEERLSIQRMGWTISGQFDRLVVTNGHLFDYKFTSCATIVGGPREEWVAQMNILAAILREHGYKVSRLSVVYFLRDWKKTRAQSSSDYPKAAAGCLDIPLWDEMEAEWYIADAIKRHQTAADVIPECSDAERWKRGDTYAVFKHGSTRAMKLFDSESDALDFLHAKEAEAEAKYQAAMSNQKRRKDPVKDMFSIVVKRGEPIRCMYYCEVADFCDQWGKEKKLYANTEQSSSDRTSDQGPGTEDNTAGESCVQDGAGSQ